MTQERPVENLTVFTDSQEVERRFLTERVRYFEENEQRSNEFRAYQVLFDDYKIRSSPIGEVAILQYRDPSESKKESKYSNINERVKEKRWMLLGGGPEAAVATGIIAGKHSEIGEESQRLRQAIMILLGINHRFQNQQVLGDDLPEIADDIADAIIEGKFDTAIKPEKVDLLNAMLKAMEIVDSRRRKNPQKTRMMVEYALLATVPLVLFNDVAENKYENLHQALLAETEKEYFYLKFAQRKIENYWKAKSRRAQDLSLRELRDYMKDFLNGEGIKLAPFKKAAVMAQVAFLGPQTGFEKNTLLESGVREEDVGLLFSDIEIEKRFPTVNNDILYLVYGEIGRAISHTDQILYPDN